ncbi:MAG: DUF1552 domain-containing protein, partial [Deltaproteobacteria bacterium]|nr:DUF1552 domain-containing protein [Deltaproteobacteria bacterium]
NGFHMPDWTPTKTGTDWVMPHILAPLEPLRKKIVVLSGLDHHQTAEPAQPPGGHASGTAPFLTMRRVNGNINDPLRTSIDQVIAEQSPFVKRPMPSVPTLPSMQLALAVDHLKGGSDGAGNTAFVENISWNKNVPQANIQAPQLAFDRIFTGFSPVATNADQQRRTALRASVLDSVAKQTQALQGKLNASDRIKADQYFTSIRALETRIQSLGAGGGATCTKPLKTTLAATAPYAERLPVMFELAALAFQCDITRVMTFMVGRSTSHENFAFLTGSTSEHHDTSHHGNNPANLAKLKAIGRWQMEHFAKFLTRVDGMIEANGKSVLDNMCVYFSSEISDGNAHKKFDMPVLLAGDLGGKMKTGGNHFMYTAIPFPRPLVGPSGGPHTGKVLISIANAFGVPITTFGDGAAKGPLTDILA